MSGTRAGDGLGENAGGGVRVEQSEVEEVGVDRIEPLARLREQLERGAKAVGGGRAIAALPRAGAGEDLAGEALVIEAVRVTHRGRQVAEPPAGGAEGEEVGDDRVGFLVVGQLRAGEAAEEAADEGGAL